MTRAEKIEEAARAVIEEADMTPTAGWPPFVRADTMDALRAALALPAEPVDAEARCADCGIEKSIHTEHRPMHHFRAPAPRATEPRVVEGTREHLTLSDGTQADSSDGGLSWAPRATEGTPRSGACDRPTCTCILPAGHAGKCACPSAACLDYVGEVDR